MLHKHPLEMHPIQDEVDEYLRFDREVLDTGETIAREQSFTHPNGSIAWLYTVKTPLRQADGTVNMLAIAADITERKRAQDRLAQAQQQQSALLDSIPDMAWLKDRESRYIAANKPVADGCGLRTDEIAGKTDLDLWPRDLVERYRADDRIVMKYGVMKRMEEPFEDATGHRIWIETIKVPIWGDRGEIVGTAGIARDITTRKQAEARMLQVNRILRLLSDCNSALVHSTDEQALIHQVCGILTDHGGYGLAWVGYAEDPPKSTLRPIARTGPAAEYIAAVDWCAPEMARSPAMEALRTGRPVALHDFASEPLFRPWLERAETFGLASCVALPLKMQDRVFGVLALHATRTHAFDAEEIVLLSELADDLAFGIIVLRTRAERDHAVEARERSMHRAQKSLEDAIQAIAYTVELRDAYTAGHQRRSTDLAVRIAKEMGLSQERIRGIRLASVVHDIGNIQVPASILSKPARLTTLEYQLVQSHCQAGFEILKGVEFPWPIAEAALQHQERLDGSGYPRGLTADQILIEARVIAVADVVTAMTSHRPYRRALGIDAALAEILRGRGTQYDAEAVDACTRLFRDKGYKLPS